MKFKLPINKKDYDALLKKYGEEELYRLMDKYNIQLVVLEHNQK